MAKVFFRKVGIKLIAAGMVILGLFLLMDLSFREVIETVNAYECREIVESLINRAISEELESEETDYSKLVTLSKNNDGEVISVESNIVNINKLKTGIIKRLEHEIDQLSSYNIEIPIGTLLGIQLLHGKGFNVGMTVEPVGTASTTIISRFTSAGINQTLHRIEIEISADVDSIIPGFTSRVPVKTTVIAAETVIVGRVPDAYTHVIASEEIDGYLNDYGATLN